MDNLYNHDQTSTRSLRKENIPQDEQIHPRARLRNPQLNPKALWRAPGDHRMNQSRFSPVSILAKSDFFFFIVPCCSFNSKSSVSFFNKAARGRRETAVLEPESQCELQTLCVRMSWNIFKSTSERSHHLQSPE